MDGVVTLEKIATSERHMTSKTFKRLHISVSENVPLQVLVSGKRLAAVGTEHHFGRLVDGVEGLEASEGSAGVLRRSAGGYQ